MSWIVSLLVLSGLIFFHELGHYIVARMMGVYVEVFSIGFGKKLFSFHKFGTQWSISAIPLGGYVKMKGQNDNNPNEKNYEDDSYTTKTPLQKILILLAGPFANFLLAFILYFLIALGGPQVPSPIIGKIVKDSPAFISGLKKDDKIISINKTPIINWKDISEAIALSNGSLNITIERQGYLEHKILTPKLTQTTNMFKEVIQKKMIGIGSSRATQELQLSFFQTFSYAYEQTIFASTMIFTSVKKLIFAEVASEELGGIISIVKVTSDATSAGWMSVLFFAALISVNLGVLNLLPIPALDGGHIMFNLYELIFKREASEAVVINLTIMGWVLLFSLMGLGLFNDINRLIG